jgi:hypothetical protein
MDRQSAELQPIKTTYEKQQGERERAEAKLREQLEAAKTQKKEIESAWSTAVERTVQFEEELASLRRERDEMSKRLSSERQRHDGESSQQLETARALAKKLETAWTTALERNKRVEAELASLRRERDDLAAKLPPDQRPAVAKKRPEEAESRPAEPRPLGPRPVPAAGGPATPRTESNKVSPAKPAVSSASPFLRPLPPLRKPQEPIRSSPARKPEKPVTSTSLSTPAPSMASVPTPVKLSESAPAPSTGSGQAPAAANNSNSTSAPASDPTSASPAAPAAPDASPAAAQPAPEPGTNPPARYKLG